MSVANRLGASMLPFMNPRVVCPPGRPAHNGRLNIVVATPMRSGTHLLIDLLLNNLPEYRTRPLYIDLDQCYKQSTGSRDLVAEIEDDAGQVIKTHLPTDLPSGAEQHDELLRVIGSAIVLTVHRDREQVLHSLARWDRTPEMLAQFEAEYDAFWSYWSGRQHLALTFSSLLDRKAMTAALAQVGELTATQVRHRVVMPLPAANLNRIYLNKALTRLAGRRAPRVDTTIHTLKG